MSTPRRPYVPTTLHHLYPMGPRTCATRCAFCGSAIYAEERHYHVTNVGPLCIDCLDKTTVIFKGQDSFVRLTQVHPPHMI